jgi:hypothetical protein
LPKISAARACSILRLVAAEGEQKGIRTEAKRER